MLVWFFPRTAIRTPCLCDWKTNDLKLSSVLMPTYEYVCEKCGAHLDIFQSMKDAPLKTCPQDKCPKKIWGKGKLKRQLGAGAGLIFKGSGFYITDYRSSGYKSAAKQDSAGGGEKSGGEKKKSGNGGGSAKGGEGKSGKSA